MPAQLRSATTSIVVLGQFNPSAFHPGWFGSRELLSGDLVDEAILKTQSVANEVMAFEAGWLAFQSLPGRIAFTSKESASHLELKDLAIGTLTLHAETPTASFGINRDAQYRMDTEEEWHAIGDRFVPNEPWAAVTDGGRAGLVRLVVQLKRQQGDVSGYTNATVGPLGGDEAEKLGVFVGINDHFQVGSEDEPSDAGRTAEVLAAEWEPSRNRANEITLRIIS